MRLKTSKILSILLSLLLIFQQTGLAQVAATLDISGKLSILHQSLTVDKFRPLHLRYLQYLPQDNSFKLLIDKGGYQGLQNEQGLSPASSNDSKGTVPKRELESTSKDLLKYFFIGLSLPNDAFWVNLRPDSPDNIIDDSLAQTDIGRILLEADVELKKDTARATSPDTSEGKEYWDKLYAKAGELYGSSNITIPTLTRPWIVPDEIIIRETTDSAYVYKATLKVMLEADYLRDSPSGLTTNNSLALGQSLYEFNDPRLKQLNEYSSQLIRELIIPKLTQTINTSKKYASLRQVYYSLILAQWFKARHSQGLSPTTEQGLSPTSSNDSKGTVPNLINS
ncbi:MAG: hypothetical protein KJ818_02135, partial [Candidatus Omnitrophica bacterium]|nr:hypothetical protein [Candidatus Omnitrophota bacterium]